MTDCLTAEDAARYRAGELASLDDLQRIDSHLAGCERCRAAVRAGNDASALARQIVSRVGDSTCLDFDTRARWVDGESDAAEREVVESHIAFCGPCAEDVAALRSFKEELSREPARIARHSGSGLWEWIRGGIGAPAYRWPLALGGAVAAACLGGLFVYAALTRTTVQESQNIRRQVAAARTESANARRTLALAQDQVKRLETKLGQSEQEKSALQQTARSATTKAQELERRFALLNGSSTNEPHSPPTRLALTLKDAGGEVGLDQRGMLSGVPTLRPDQRGALAAALKSGRVMVSKQIAALVGKGGTLMGPAAPGPFRLFGPIGTASADDRPTLKWQPLPGATGYTVTIVDDLEHSEAATGTVTASSDGTVSWKPTVPLPGGRVYRWFVAAHKDGAEVQSPTRSDPPARFLVLERAHAESVQRNLAGAGRSHLARGMAYFTAGLLDEAEGEFQALVRMNPNSTVVKRLLDSVRAVRATPHHQ